MKRDMDLVRNILLAIEEDETGFVQNGMNISEYSSEEVQYHILIMKEADLLIARDETIYGPSTPVSIPTRLTWEGHDFLDACRDESRWKEAKGVFTKMGGASADIVKMVLIKLMETQALDLMS